MCLFVAEFLVYARSCWWWLMAVLDRSGARCFSLSSFSRRAWWGIQGPCCASRNPLGPSRAAAGSPFCHRSVGLVQFQNCARFRTRCARASNLECESLRFVGELDQDILVLHVTFTFVSVVVFVTHHAATHGRVVIVLPGHAFV